MSSVAQAARRAAASLPPTATILPGPLPPVLLPSSALFGVAIYSVAARAGVQDEVKEALLKAHFVDAQDIGDDEVLVAIGTAAGLDELAILAVVAGDHNQVAVPGGQRLVGEEA